MTRIMTHPHNKGVMAYIIVNQDGIPIRAEGLDKTVTIQYAGLISHLCTKARAAIRDAEPEKPVGTAPVQRKSCFVEARTLTRACFWYQSTDTPFLQNELTFLRLRSQKHEILVAPDKDYLLIIIQNPNVNLGGS